MSGRHPPVPASLARHGIERLRVLPSAPADVRLEFPDAGQRLFSLYRHALMRFAAQRTQPDEAKHG